MSNIEHLKNRTRNDYGYFLEYRTRWADNDMYAHVNNSVYNIMIDSAINAYLIEKSNLHPPTSPQRALVVHSHTDFFAPLEYPAVAELGLRVNSLGKSSVRYEVGVFEKGCNDGGVKAVGEVVHVFVDSKTGKPCEKGMGEEFRVALGAIAVKGGKSKI